VIKSIFGVREFFKNLWVEKEFLKNLGLLYVFYFLKIWGRRVVQGKPFCEIFHRLSRNITPPKSFLVRRVESGKVLRNTV